MNSMMAIVTRLRFAGLAAALACLLCACAVYQPRQTVETPFNAAERFDADGAVPAPDRWWTALNDETLDRMIGEGLSDNLSLKQAWARLGQARAQAELAGVQLYPLAEASGDASRYRNENNGFVLEDDSWMTTLAASYEVDLWKRIASGRQAALLDVDATRQDLSATALTLTGGIASTWYTIVQQRALLDLLHQQEDVSKTFLDLIELRFSQGRSTAVEVYQQREQLASIRTDIPAARSQLEFSEHQLAVLLGRSPTGFHADERAGFPKLPPLPMTGAPAALLQRRPDVASALTRVIAADYRVGAAIADKYPALRLTARTQLQGNDIGDAFSNWLWNLAGSLALPILDGGRRQAEIERTRAVVDERVAQYESAALNAIREVENALTQESRQREYLDALNIELDESRRAFEESRNRFRDGVGDYLSVLTSLLTTQRIERQLIAARRGLLEYRIDLYIALGGSWMETLAPETPAAFASGDAS